MKVYKKIVLILLLIITTLLVFSTIVNGAIIDTDSYNPGTLSVEDAGKMTTATAKIVKVIRYIGIVATIIVIAIMGLKFIFSSAEEKVNYKEGMISLIVGCLLIILTTTIPSLVYYALN